MLFLAYFKLSQTLKLFLRLTFQIQYTLNIFLPVIDETFSLEKTISEIEKKSSRYTKKYLITISKSKTTLKSLKKIKILKKKYKKKVKVIYQEKPFLKQCLMFVEK